MSGFFAPDGLFVKDFSDPFVAVGSCTQITRFEFGRPALRRRLTRSFWKHSLIVPILAFRREIGTGLCPFDYRRSCFGHPSEDASFLLWQCLRKKSSVWELNPQYPHPMLLLYTAMKQRSTVPLNFFLVFMQLAFDFM